MNKPVYSEESKKEFARQFNSSFQQVIGRTMFYHTAEIGDVVSYEVFEAMVKQKNLEILALRHLVLHVADHHSIDSDEVFSIFEPILIDVQNAIWQDEE